jgi:structure-specific recognition protein 1
VFFLFLAVTYECAGREDIAKYDRLKKNYEDPTFEVVSGVFRALAKKKIIGSGSFQR